VHLFYSPDIEPPFHTLNEEESRHCVRVLRLGAGDRLMLTDGRGHMYTAEVCGPDARRCRVHIVETVAEYCQCGYRLTMAVAPTKNVDRYEWFLEKATEVGCDVFVPLECARSERRTFRPDRALRVITGAVKQSLKAYHPVLEPLTAMREIVSRPFDGVRMIAHCGATTTDRKYISQCVAPGDNVLILIGPEGDFTPEEVSLAVTAGFTEISLGTARLRTETAAIDAVIEVALANRTRVRV